MFDWWNERLDNNAYLIGRRLRDHRRVQSAWSRKTPRDPYSCSLLSLFRAVNINGHKRVSLRWSVETIRKRKRKRTIDRERERERERKGERDGHSWLSLLVVIERTQLCALRARKTLMTYSRWRSFHVILFLKVRASRRVYLCIFNFLDRGWTGCCADGMKAYVMTTVVFERLCSRETGLLLKRVV